MSHATSSIKKVLHFCLLQDVNGRVTRNPYKIMSQHCQPVRKWIHECIQTIFQANKTNYIRYLISYPTSGAARPVASVQKKVRYGNMTGVLHAREGARARHQSCCHTLATGTMKSTFYYFPLQPRYGSCIPLPYPIDAPERSPVNPSCAAVRS